MRRGKRIVSVLLTATLMTISALTPMETKAGSTTILLDGESLVTSEWNNPEGDVVVEEGKLIFPDESTDYTRFIAKNPVKKEERATALVLLTASIKFNKLPQNKSFILAFGMSSIEAVTGDAGNIEVAFTNDGGIKAGITVYNDEGKAEVLVAPKNCGISLNREAKVNVKITTDRKIEVSVNNTVVASGKLPISGEGRVGFLQTGKCSAVVSNIELVHYEYDRPENTNIAEDFETGGIDVSKLTAKMLWASVNAQMGQVVEDYNGNQVLMHRNTGAAYIGTVYRYSNFEMTFDVPFLKVTKEYAEDGSLTSAGFDKLVVTLGGERADWDTVNWNLAAETIVLERGKVYSNSNKETILATMAKNPFEQGKPFSVKVSMIDSVVTVGMKWLEEKTFQTVLQYKLKGGTPTGYVHIWAPSAANFSIDNLKITNLDEDANVIETEYKSGKIQVPEGKAPEPMERVYKKAEEKQGLSWYLLIPATAGVGVIALLITALAVRGRKKEKESEVIKIEQKI